jgi:hypothetical protein
MHIVAIGWMYVVLMMSLTETSFVAGVMTFVFYGAVPVGIIWYLSGPGKRRARARATQQAAANQAATEHQEAVNQAAAEDAPGLTSVAEFSQSSAAPASISEPNSLKLPQSPHTPPSLEAPPPPPRAPPRPPEHIAPSNRDLS